MKTLFVLAALLACVFATTFDDLAFGTDGINDFDNCKVLVGLAAAPEKVAAVLFWNINQAGNSINFGVSALSDGYVGFGISADIAAPPNRMFNNDVVIGFFNPFNGFAASVEDYFVDDNQILCDISNVGVCRDVDKALPPSSVPGCVDNLSGRQLNFNNATGVIHMRYTRPLNSNDNNCDVDITNADTQLIFAFSPLKANRLDYHDSGRDSIVANLFQPATCPTGPNGLECSGIGTCNKGCCVCPEDSGADCSVQAGGGAGGDVFQVVNAENFPFRFVLDDRLTLNWALDEENGEIQIALECTCTGWIAFGPSEGLMIGTDAILGWIEADGTLNINDYLIEERAFSGIIPDVQAQGTNDILGSFGKVENGVTTIIFKRKLDTGDARDLPYVQGVMDVSWAYNPDTPGPTLVQHLGNTKNPIEIDFFSGVVNVNNEIDAMRKAHGSMMFVVWSVAIPFTSFIARYLKGQLGKAWFEIHRIVNGIAMVVQLAAFILAVIFSPDNHFNTPHKIIGLVVFILGTVQPILGTIADRLFDPNRDGAPIFPDKVHWIIGWLSLGLGLANIVLGLEAYGALIEIFYASIALSGFIGVFMIVFFIQNLITKWPPPPDHH